MIYEMVSIKFPGEKGTLHHDSSLTRKRMKLNHSLPPAALPGAKLLKKFDQNF